MYKLNMFVAMSALAIAMGSANAVQFDEGNPFSEGNKTLAQQLYRGGLKTLDNEPKGLSESAQKEIEQKKAEFKSETWEEAQDRKTAIFWSHTVGNPYIKEDEDKADKLRNKFNDMWNYNQGVENDINSLTANGTYLINLSVDYREVEGLKLAAQGLHNAYNNANASGSVVKAHLTKTQKLLSGFDEEVIKKILNHSDVK